MAILRTRERMGEFVENQAGQPTRSLPLALYKRGEVVYEVQRVRPENTEYLRERALRFEEMLGYSRFRTPLEVITNVQPGAEVVFAGYRGRFRRTFGLPPKDVGVLTYEVKTATVDGEQIKVAATGVRAVDERFQGYGIGTDLTKDTILRHTPHALTGRSRNWAVYRSLDKTGLLKEKTASTISRGPTSRILRILEQTLSRSKFSEMDPEAGVVRNVYPEADPAEFTPPSGHVAGWEIQKALEAKGVKAGGRHGYRYYLETDPQAIQDALPEYQALLAPEPLTVRRPFIKAIAEKIANRLGV